MQTLLGLKEERPTAAPAAATEALTPKARTAEQASGPGPDEIFAGIFLESPVPAKGLSASFGFHVVLVSLIVGWRFIGPSDPFPYRIRTYEPQIVRYTLPQPLLFASAGRQARGGASHSGKAGSAAAAGRQGRRAGGGSRSARPKIQAPAPEPSPALEAAAAPEKPAAPRLVFEVPQRQVSPQRDLVIQPDFNTEIRITGKVQLPNLFLWMPAEIQAPQKQLKTFVPGQPKPRDRTPMVLPDAPKLELPNQQVHVADLKLGPAPQPIAKPALPVFAATTSPVRAQRRVIDALSELPVTPLPLGQAVNLLSLMNQPAPPTAVYSVEGGNRFPASAVDATANGAGGGSAQAGKGAAEGSGTKGSAGAGDSGVSGQSQAEGRGQGAAAGGAANGAGSVADGVGNGADTGRTGTGTGAAGSGVGTGTGRAGTGPGTGATGTGRGTRTSGGPGTGTTGAGTGTRGAGSGSGTGSRGTGTGSTPGGAGTEVAALRLGPNSVAIRIESPNTSTFDVVVVNPGGGETLPDSQGVLTGQPVYTVYMAVPGSRREWILQYAVPNGREPVQQRTENSIRLGAVTPVRAPYPLRKASLEVTDTGGQQGHVVVYGLISEKGSLEEIRVIRGVRSEIDSAVVACLQQFVFRPAVRDGVPVLVEALFGVPLN